MVSGLAQQALSPEWNVPPVDQPPPPAADWSEGKIRWPRLAGQGDSSIMTQGGSSSQEEVGVTQALIRLPHGLWGQRNLTDLSHQLGEGSVSLLEKSLHDLSALSQEEEVRAAPTERWSCAGIRGDLGGARHWGVRSSAESADLTEMMAVPACTWSTFQITHAVLTTTHPVDRRGLEKLEESLGH